MAFSAEDGGRTDADAREGWVTPDARGMGWDGVTPDARARDGMGDGEVTLERRFEKTWTRARSVSLGEILSSRERRRR